MKSLVPFAVLLLRAASRLRGRPSTRVVRHRGAFIGANVRLGRHVRIGGAPPLTVHIDDGAVLGDHAVLLGHGASVLGEGDSPRATNKTVIGRNATVGARSVVLAGVTVGPYSTVGPDSLVTTDVPAGADVAGVPARPTT